MKKSEIQPHRVRKNNQSNLQQRSPLREGTKSSGTYPHLTGTSAKILLHATGGRNRRNASRKGKRSHRILRNTKLYKQGYNRGYEDGVLQGQNSFGIVFEGVSIIIPTYNQRDYVLQCVSSIEKHTPLLTKSSL